MGVGVLCVLIDISLEVEQTLLMLTFSLEEISLDFTFKMSFVLKWASLYFVDENLGLKGRS